MVSARSFRQRHPILSSGSESWTGALLDRPAFARLHAIEGDSGRRIIYLDRIVEKTAAAQKDAWRSKRAQGHFDALLMIAVSEDSPLFAPKPGHVLRASVRRSRPRSKATQGGLRAVSSSSRISGCSVTVARCLPTGTLRLLPGHKARSIIVAPSTTEFSVIVPTCRRNRTLMTTLRALTLQRYPLQRFEVLIVNDDPSPDRELRRQIDAMLRGSKIRCRYVQHDANRGPGAARNTAIRIACGRNFLFIGDDMIPHPDLVGEHARYLRRHDRAAILGFVAWHPALRRTPFMDWLAPWGYMFNFDPPLAHDCGFQYFWTSNISLSREVLANQRFDESFYYGYEDSELGYRLSLDGIRVIYNPDALVYHYHPMVLWRFLYSRYLSGKGLYRMVQKHPEIDSPLKVLLKQAYHAFKHVFFPLPQVKRNVSLRKHIFWLTAANLICCSGFWWRHIPRYGAERLMQSDIILFMRTIYANETDGHDAKKESYTYA